MPPTWSPIFAMPSLDLAEPIESPWAAIVPVSDERVKVRAAQHPNFRKYVRSFSDPFGGRLRPAMFMLRDGLPEAAYTAEAIGGFRDIVVAATVPYTRARWMPNGGHSGVHYSDSLAFHPWSLGRDYLHLVSFTPAQTALHEVEKFRGQPSAGLPVTSMGSFDIDAPLLNVLVERWGRLFLGQRRSREDIALFRSVHMANEAMKVAGGAESLIYDFGRQTGLWVSAFEILLHPGGRSDAIKERHIREWLGTLEWRRRDLRAAQHTLRWDGEPVMHGGAPVRVTLPQLIYFQLNAARNDFLHGNPVSARALRLQPKGQPLGYLAAALYRAALAAKLDLVWREPSPPLEDAAAWGEWVGRRSSFLRPQDIVEDALAVARVPPEDRDLQRRAMLKRRQAARRLSRRTPTARRTP